MGVGWSTGRYFIVLQVKLVSSHIQKINLFATLTHILTQRETSQHTVVGARMHNKSQNVPVENKISHNLAVV